MNLFEKIGWYWRNRGIAGLVKRVIKGRAPSPDYVLTGHAGGVPTRSGNATKASHATTSAHLLVSDQFPSAQPMRVYTVPESLARLNLVTDSISAGSLFGGVGTAIILATMLASRRGARLRVVTRREAPDERGFAQVLECNGLAMPGNVEFVHLNVADGKAQLDICEGDRFLTTSWWTTASVLGSVPAERVDYLLQEDERMFYPLGDDWLRCSEVMQRNDIRFIINTELLYEHLIGTGLEHFKDTAKWFEPAFPRLASGEPTARGVTEKRKLFFYARPNNLRNLFYRGLEVLDRAVVEGILDPERWEVIFVGKDVPKVRLGGTIEPKVLPTMTWREYGEFISQVNVGVCLMCTPHPSYPPLDLAAAGAFVLTNKFGLKQSLDRYSDRILCTDTHVPALLDGLRAVIAQAENEIERGVVDDTRISRSWENSLADAVEYLN